MIRQFKSGDESQVVALWNRVLWADRISPAFFRERLLLDPNIGEDDLFVAEGDGRIVGFAVAFIRRTDLPWGYEKWSQASQGTGFLLPVVADPEYTPEKPGDRLIAAAEKHLQALGAGKVSVCGYTPLFFPDGVDGRRYPEAHRCFWDNGYGSMGTTYRMGCDLRDYAMAADVREWEKRLRGEGIVVTQCRPEHLLAVRRFLLREFSRWISPFAHKVAGRSPYEEITLAFEDGNVVGYCQYNYYGQAERAGPFGVAERLRGKNVGQVMVAHLLQGMSEAGLKFAYFDSTGARQTKFFSKNGFAVFGERTVFEKLLGTASTPTAMIAP